MAENNPDSTPQNDEFLVSILEELLQKDENISARAVARLHPGIGHASTITRSQHRSSLLAKYQNKQRDIRRYSGRISKRSKEKIAEELSTKDQRIAELERQVKLLQASHLAMIRAVGELGGMKKWMKFFENFRETRDQLYELGAMPNVEIAELRADDGIIPRSRK